MDMLLSIPVMVVLMMIQTIIVNRLPLVNGAGDLLLVALIAWGLHPRVRNAWVWGVVAGLLATVVSAMPTGVYLAAYLFAMLLAYILRRRIWQAPILAMLVGVLAATLAQHILSLGALIVNGAPLPLQDSFYRVALPSLLINLLFALPVYAAMTDLANWLYPAEGEQ